MNAAKIALLAVWLLCAAGFVVQPETALAGWARLGFWLMLAAHGVEFVLFYTRLQAAPGSLAAHFLNTLVFGVLHIRSVPQEEN